MGILDTLFGAARVKATEAADGLVSNETKMKTHILELTDVYNKSNASFIRFKTDLDMVQQDISKTNDSIARIDKGLETMKQRFAAMSDEEKAKEKPSFVANAQVLLDQKTGFQTQVDTLTKRYDEMQPQVSQLKASLDSVAADLKKAKEQLQELTTRGNVADTQNELADAIIATRSTNDPSKSKMEEEIQRREIEAKNKMAQVQQATSTSYQDVLDSVEKTTQPKASAEDLFK